MASTRKSYLAIIKEASTATAVKPTNFIKYKDGDILLAQEIIENNPICSNRWNPITAVPGKITTDGTFNVDTDVREAVWWLYGALGSVSSADISSLTDGSVYTHTITTADTLPSFTVEQGKGNLADGTGTNNGQTYSVERSFGVLVDSFTLSASDALVNLEVNVKAHGIFQKSDLISDAAAGSSVDLSLESVEGLTTADTVNIYDSTPQNEADAIASINTTAKTIQIATLGNSYTVANSAKVELAPQTPSYTDQKIFSFTHASFQFGANLTAAASAAEENVENWEFTYENQLEERFGSLRSSPSVIAPKGAQAMLSYTKYFENVADRDRYLNQTRQACILTLTNNEIVSATDTNEAKYTVKIEMSDLRFTTYEMPTGTDELYIVNMEATCFYDSTDGRAVRILATNDEDGTAYA